MSAPSSPASSASRRTPDEPRSSHLTPLSGSILRITKERENGGPCTAAADATSGKVMLPMGLLGPGKHMQKPILPPLARSVSREVLDWDHVEPRHVAFGKDVLGLSPED